MADNAKAAPVPPKFNLPQAAPFAKDPSRGGMYSATIGGMTFDFDKWGAMDSLEALSDLLQLGGSSLGVILSAAGLSGEMPEMTPELVRLLIENVMASLRTDKKLALGLLAKFCSKGVLVNGKAIDFSEFYKEDAGLMAKVCVTAAEVQLGRFFAGSSAKAQSPAEVAG